MHINKIAATAIAASVCGALSLGVAGVAAAAVQAPARTAAMAATAAPHSSNSSAVVADLGDVLAISARLSQEAHAANPDINKLKRLQGDLKVASDRLAANIGSAGAAQSGGAGSRAAADAASDIKAQLDKLVTDVNDLLAAAVAKDLGKVGTVTNTVLADLQGLLAAVPKLIGEVTLPTVPAPLTVDQPQQSGAQPDAPQAGAPQNTAGAPQNTTGAPQNTTGAPQDTTGAPQDMEGMDSVG